MAEVASAPAPALALATHPGVVITVGATSEPRLCVLRVDVSALPTADVIADVATTVTAFARDCEGGLILHIRHTDSTPLTPLDLPRLVAVVSKLLEARDVIDAKLRGTVVETQGVDTLVDVSKSIFLTLYQPRRPFDVVGTPAAGAAFVDALVAQVREKRCRASAGA